MINDIKSLAEQGYIAHQDFWIMRAYYGYIMPYDSDIAERGVLTRYYEDLDIESIWASTPPVDLSIVGRPDVEEMFRSFNTSFSSRATDNSSRSEFEDEEDAANRSISLMATCV